MTTLKPSTLAVSKYANHLKPHGLLDPDPTILFYLISGRIDYIPYR